MKLSRSGGSLKRISKPKRWSISYDWGVSPDTGKLLDGLKSEMFLVPVKVSLETGEPISDKKSKFTKKEWSSGTVCLHWLWPGEREKTLLSLLIQGKLTRTAGLYVKTLKAIRKGDEVEEGKAKDWAKEFLRRESAISKGVKSRAKTEGGFVPDSRRVDGDKGSRKQNANPKRRSHGVVGRSRAKS